MLNTNTLSKDIQDIMEDVLPSALESALRSLSGEESDAGVESAQTFAKNLTEMMAKPFADRLAASIDRYIKSGCIYGTILTVGSEFTQTAVIAPGSALGMPTSGKVPNTLGIQ